MMGKNTFWGHMFTGARDEVRDIWGEEALSLPQVWEWERRGEGITAPALPRGLTQ